MKTMRKLNLDILKTTLPGITSGQGYFLWESAILCLEEHEHSSGAVLKVNGKFKEEFQLFWTGKVTDEMRQSWGDVKEATEYGAMALAVLLIYTLTDFIITGRSRQGTRVDYHLVSSEQGHTVFSEPEAALEASGILKETKGNTINMRINDKIRRLQETGFENLPTFVVVTAFNYPTTKIVQK